MEEKKSDGEIIKPAKYTLPTNFIDFIKRQDDIFRKDFICSDKVEKEGIKCTLPDLENCYYVGLIHDDKINSKIEDFSSRIASITPAVKYNQANIHTTFANGYINRMNNFKADQNIIDKLVSIVEKTPKKNSPLVYHSWLMNQGGIIASAYGNESFFNTAYWINQEAKKLGLDLNFPWGAHVSVSRFSESGKLKKEISDLIAKENPLGESRPVKINIGTAYTTKNEFLLNEYHSVNL